MPPLPPVITSRSNARVKALRQSLSGEARRPGDLLGLEGPNLVKEALRAGLHLDTVYLREGYAEVLDAPWLDKLRTREWAVLQTDIFDSASSTSAPQPIAATWIIEEPNPRKQEFQPSLVLENLQDPGNLGTLIRTAAAFGFWDIAITPESVNPWNPKVVRAAAGSLFYTRVRKMPLREIADRLRAQEVRLFAAVSSFDSSPDREMSMAAPHGVPMGRRLNRDLPAGAGYPEFPPGPVAGSSFAASLSQDTDFVGNHAILIGNEGAGLSLQARRLADEEVRIPCNVESLNAAIAGSILMYESARQRMLRRWAQKQGLRP